jgi:hypothetical protein
MCHEQENGRTRNDRDGREDVHESDCTNRGCKWPSYSRAGVRTPAGEHLPKQREAENRPWPPAYAAQQEA